MGKTVGNQGNKVLKIIFLLFSLAAFGTKQAMAGNLNEAGKSISFVRKSENVKPVVSFNADSANKIIKSEKSAKADDSKNSSFNLKADKKIKKTAVNSNEAAGTSAQSMNYKKGDNKQISSPLDLLKKEKAAKKQAVAASKNEKQVAKPVQKQASVANKSAASPNPIKPVPIKTASVKTATEKANIAQDVTAKPVVKMASVEKKATSFRETMQPKAKESVTYVSEAQMFRELGMDVMADNANDAGAYASSVRPQDVAPYQKVGSPYQVNGKWYIPSHEPEYDETGIASWYGEQFNGKKTANGETYDMNEVTIAHPTLPLPSLVEVTNLDNGRTIIARANDRGPFASSRIIDVSKRAAELLGFKDKGTANVRVRYVGQAPQINDGDNNKIMLASNDANKAKPIAKPAVMAEKPVVKAPSAPVKLTAPVILAQNTSPKAQAVQSVAKSLNYVQIGAFASRANADRLANSSKLQGDVKITEVQTANGIMYRVLLAQSNEIQANNQSLGKKQFYANAD